jgi:cytochrome c oxidase subunit 3
LAINRIGIWLFFLSETFLFGTLIATLFYLRDMERSADVDQVLGLAITIVLLLSSLTAYRAETAAAHGDQKTFRWNLFATILLGLGFVAGVGYEWYLAFQHFPPSSAYGTVFFTITGIHAFHVITGIILLAAVAYRGRKPERFGEGHSWGVEGSVKYWHFVDVAWVFIYPTLYLVGLVPRHSLVGRAQRCRTRPFAVSRLVTRSNSGGQVCDLPRGVFASGQAPQPTKFQRQYHYRPF